MNASLDPMIAGSGDQTVDASSMAPAEKGSLGKDLGRGSLIMRRR